MLVVIAKRCPAGDVGDFSLAFAITAPMFLFSMFQLRTLLATDVHNMFTFREYLRLRIYASAVTMITLLFMLAVIDSAWITSATILIVGFSKAFETITDIFHGLYQQQERMDIIGISMVFKGALSLVCLGVTAYLTGSMLWSVSAIAVVSLVMLLFYDWNGRWGLPRWDGQLLNQSTASLDESRTWKLIKQATPLGVVTLATALNSNIPRFAVEYHLGREALGAFAVVAYMYAAGSVVAAALAQGATATLARRAADRDVAGFLRITARLVGIAALAGLLGVIIASRWGVEMLSILYRPEYGAYSDVLFWMTVATAISVMAAVGAAAMQALRLFSQQPVLYGLTLIATSLTSYLYVRNYGLRGAAYAVIVGIAIQLVGSFGICAFKLVDMSKAHKSITHPIRHSLRVH